MPVALEELLAYDAWANRRVAESLKQDKTPPRALELFAHILGAQEIWLNRLGGMDSSGVEVWPSLTAAECEHRQQRMERALSDYLSLLGPERLEEPISYRTTAGKEFRNTPVQILTHLVFHGQHHRGQIAACMREAEATPAVTDFIAQFRES